MSKMSDIAHESKNVVHIIINKYKIRKTFKASC